MRDYAAQQGVNVEGINEDQLVRMIDVEAEMQQKSKEFMAQGAELYHKV